VNEVTYIDLGLKDYKETWDYQVELQQKIIEAKMEQDRGAIMNYLIFVEHPHVYTLGKSGKENNLLIQESLLKSIGAALYKIDRGGDITYHGPGQLVGYPILDLDSLGMGVKEYIYKLEQAVIETLANFNIPASRMEGATGVWLDTGNSVQARKICAIGVKVSRSVTLHGFALNINTDLNYFSYINPCGFADKGVTSLEKELGAKQSMEKIKDLLLNTLQQIFQWRAII
jgi:lipoyl(octanoyl) transferase